MEQSIYEMVKDFIGSVGFPIFVAVFLLVRLEPRFRELRDVLIELKELVSHLNSRMGSD